MERQDSQLFVFHGNQRKLLNWEEWSRLLHCLPVYPTYRLDASHCYVPVREISCGNMCDTRPFLSLFIAKNSSFLRTLSFLIYLETAGLITIERVPLLFFTGVSYAYTARVWIDCFPWRQPPPPTHIEEAPRRVGGSRWTRQYSLDQSDAPK